MVESCTVCSSCSRWPVRKLLDTPSYIHPFSIRPFGLFRFRIYSDTMNPSDILYISYLGLVHAKASYLHGTSLKTADIKPRHHRDSNTRSRRSRGREWSVDCGTLNMLLKLNPLINISIQIRTAYGSDNFCPTAATWVMMCQRNYKEIIISKAYSISAEIFYDEICEQGANSFLP
jgi:hypothetical protein